MGWNENRRQVTRDMGVLLPPRRVFTEAQGRCPFSAHCRSHPHASQPSVHAPIVTKWVQGTRGGLEGGRQEGKAQTDQVSI